MALHPQIEKLSLNKLKAQRPAEKNNAAYQALLVAVNQQAALADIVLHEHQDDDLAVLLNDIDAHFLPDDITPEATALQIFNRLQEEIRVETVTSLAELNSRHPEKKADAHYQTLLENINRQAGLTGIILCAQSEDILAELFTQLEAYGNQAIDEGRVLCIFKRLKSMIEKEGIATKSLHALQALQPNKQDNIAYQNLLIKINKLAASHDIFLDKQSEDVLTALFYQLESITNQAEDESVPLHILSVLTEIIDKETAKNKSDHARQGGYAITRAHRRSLKSQLEDHDMASLMPTSTGGIEVFAAVDRFKTNTHKAVQNDLRNALLSPETNHIFIPIGPGHWRGFYLSKPTQAHTNYQLELFDPYGPAGAKSIEAFAKHLLEASIVLPDQLDITFAGPIKPQRDGYACGDFTCAYSHKKMRQLGIMPEEAYSEVLIETLDKKGNANDELRYKTRAIFEEKHPTDKAFSSHTQNNHTSFEQFKSLDAHFYFRCLAKMTMLVGGIMLLVSLALAMPKLAIVGFLTASVGFFSLQDNPKQCSETYTAPTDSPNSVY